MIGEKKNTKANLEKIKNNNTFNPLKKNDVFHKNISECPFNVPNFLIDETSIRVGMKKNDYTYYENIVFPFRNFKDEIANLKYRHFYVLINKDLNDVNLNDSYKDEDDTIEELQYYLGNLFTNKNNIIEI